MAMLTYAREISHATGNPGAEIATCLSDIVEDFATPESVVRDALGALHSTKWIRVKGGDPLTVDADQDITIQVTSFLKYNHPKGSEADRKAISRERKKEQDMQGLVTPCPNVVTEREKEREKENKEKPLTLAEITALELDRKTGEDIDRREALRLRTNTADLSPVTDRDASKLASPPAPAQMDAHDEKINTKRNEKETHGGPDTETDHPRALDSQQKNIPPAGDAA